MQHRLVLHQVYLVQNGDHPLRVCSQFPQHVHRRLIKVEYPWVTGVQYVDQEIGKNSLFERRLECFYQAMRQIPDKPYGVGEEQDLARWENHPTSRRIERRE